VDAAAWIEKLGLVPHPEGGHYVETWRDGDSARRGAGTAIYFLLERGQRSHFHRVDAVEIWHYYAGAPLELETATSDAGPVVRRVLGTDFEAGQRPQLCVAAGDWQAARSLGAYTLVGCTVSPAFTFAGFELAPPGFRPGA
jgi:predicted cupin superfamily sugar epimerase